LAAAIQTITGTESDPSKTVFLDWRTTGTPIKTDGDWVQTTVDSKGNFSASVNIDHPGTQSTMFYYSDGGPVTKAWSAIPH